MLTERDLAALTALRAELHRNAEPSGREERTARIIADFLTTQTPDEIIEGLGGHGIAAIYQGASPGPSLMFRADMDALPIPEDIEIDGERITRPVSHRCGHDGHMATVCGMALSLHRERPAKGRVILLFQPAEETGEGAARVLADPRFDELLAPTMAFALHNLPGYPLGTVVLREGVFAAASTGLNVRLDGATSHAAEPQKGRTPAPSVARIINALTATPQVATALGDAAKVTVVHASVGERDAFGTSPGRGLVQATLRTLDNELMDHLLDRCIDGAKAIAAVDGLACEAQTTQEFKATVNAPKAVEILERAANDAGLDVHKKDAPFPWSEDFGRFIEHRPGALAGLGIGARHPNLHNPSYEFRDELIAHGVALLERVLAQILR